MPDGEITFDDLVRGEITFHTDHVPDFALARANGQPLYTLVNPVDDALMEITHVLRGEDLLSSTPRQIALYQALEEIGIAKSTPRFGHLPYVMGEGNKKLSKRDPEAHLLGYRDAGFLPEGLLNYLALLGWAIAEDRDVFTLEEMVAAFDIARVNPNPARFDLKKAEAINAAHMRMLSVEELTDRVTPYLQQAGVLSDPVTPAQGELLSRAVPLVHERINKLTDAAPMLGFLFTDDVTYDEADVAKVLDDEGLKVVAAARESLGALSAWTTLTIEEALRAALVDGLGLKPRNAFGPVRVAVTGQRISPHSSSPSSCSAASSRCPGSTRHRPRRTVLMSYPQGPPPGQQPWPPHPQLQPHSGRRTRSSRPIHRNSSGSRGCWRTHTRSRALPADVAHLGLRLVEAGGRHPDDGGRRPVGDAPAPDAGAGRRSRGRRRVGLLRRPVRGLGEPRLGDRRRRCSTSTCRWPL